MPYVIFQHWHDSNFGGIQNITTGSIAKRNRISFEEPTAVKIHPLFRILVLHIMPHSTKKKKEPNKPKPSKASSHSDKRSNRMTFILICVIIAIVAGAGGFYAFSTAQHTLSSASSSTTSTLVSSSGLVYADLTTSKGTIEVELFQSLVPATVNNFVTLAKNGFYNNLVWHRIVSGFVIQTGDPTSRNGGGVPCNWGQTSATTTIPFQSVSSLHNYAGTLGMASTTAGAGGESQFYINLGDNSASLDGKYAVFGQVISGMSAVDALGSLATSSCSTGGTPPTIPTQALLNSITILSSP